MEFNVDAAGRPQSFSQSSLDRLDQKFQEFKSLNMTNLLQFDVLFNKNHLLGNEVSHQNKTHNTY